MTRLGEAPWLGSVTVAPALSDRAEGAEALTATSGAGLLDAFASLTHRMHAADDRAADLLRLRQPAAARDRKVLALDLRAQRDLVRAELLTRMGETP